MLLKRELLEAIVSGQVSVVFRCWKRPTVKAGGTLRTAMGVLAIQAVDAVTVGQIKASDARAAGYASRAKLLSELPDTMDGRQLYRIRVAFQGADPRTQLRTKSRLGAQDRAEIEARLIRYDRASRRGPWTRKILDLIARHPHTRAADLAEFAGFEKAWLKTNIRKLKELGLTESLSPGYRLSPRGRSFLKKR